MSINNTIETTSNLTEDYQSFEVMNLDMNLSRGIFGHFKTPSAIQRQAIVPMATGRDMIIQAQSFSGKTSACCIALIQHLLSKGVTEKSPTCALIVCPTRELAIQTCDAGQSIANYTKLHFHLSIGGLDRAADIQTVRGRQAQVLVATPGRGLDLLTKIKSLGRGIMTLVLDDADLLVDDSFRDTINNIMGKLNKNIQIVLAARTMPEDKMRDIVGIMRNPAKILVKAEELTLEGIRQYYVEAPNAQGKKELLGELYSLMNISSAIVFCNAKETAEDVATYLKENDHSVEAYHVDLTQEVRGDRFDRFCKGQITVLVTTDRLARAFNGQSVGHIFNFDLPSGDRAIRTYLDRISCSGRYGRKGIAINFVTEKDYDMLEEISSHYAVGIEALPEDLERLC